MKFKQWRLNRALRKHAKWKARAEAELELYSRLIFPDPFRASELIAARGKQAYWMEAAEQIMREENNQ